MYLKLKTADKNQAKKLNVRDFQERHQKWNIYDLEIYDLDILENSR